MNSRPLALVIGLLVLLFGIALASLWLLPAPSGRAVAVNMPEEPWRLDLPRRPDVDAQLAAVMAARLLGTAPAAQALPAAAVQEESLTPPDWRIAAVYGGAGQSVAVIATAGKPDRQVKVGDSLPGGAKILAIGPDRICIALNGKRLSLSTYPE